MGKRISQLAEITTVDSDDLLNVVDVSDTTYSASGTNKKVKRSNLIKDLTVNNLASGVLDTDLSSVSSSDDTIPSARATKAFIDSLTNGWIPAEETWTYVSTDDPTGVIKINANVTSKYSEGMRLKMTNGGNTIYAIITKMGTYGGDEAGYTYITFLHEIDPTDSKALHLMANSAITSSYYSTQKAPQGFPLSPSKWSVEVIDTSVRTQSNPTKDVWYNLGTTACQITVPIGVWKLKYNVIPNPYNSALVTNITQFVTLSTANNSESNPLLTIYAQLSGASSNMLAGNFLIGRDAFVDVAIKTTYYLNAKTNVSGQTNITFANNFVPMTIRATCAYL